MPRPRKDGTPSVPSTPKPALTPQAIINNSLRNAVNQLESLPATPEILGQIANLYAAIQNPTPRDKALHFGYLHLSQVDKKETQETK